MPRLAALVVLASLLPAFVQAQGVYWSTKSVLKDFFRGSEKVSFVEVTGEELGRALGAKPPRDKYVVFVATTGDRIDGYAVIDEEQGQHLPITFAVKLNAEGRVVRSEVMAYREGYGEEIREERFRRQYVGKGPGDPPRFGLDVVAISGATISSRSMTTAVQRAIALVALVRAKRSPEG